MKLIVVFSIFVAEINGKKLHKYVMEKLLSLCSVRTFPVTFMHDFKNGFKSKAKMIIKMISSFIRPFSVLQT